MAAFGAKLHVRSWRGAVRTYSLVEASTVDLSQQFAGLIVTQQAYAASTKILTTAVQMLQQLISIKQ